MSLCYDLQKWTIVSIASVTISLTIGLVLMQVVYGQVETETRTFEDCFNSYSWDDVTPEDKNYTTILCNFYHEKTGQWFTEEDWNTEEYRNLINKHYPEFYAKYFDQIDRNNQRLYQKNLNNVSGSETRTFMDCYTSISTSAFLVNIFTPATIDLTNPELKQFFTNLCNFVHDETGEWLNIWNTEGLEKLMIDPDKFLMKYYPSGVPQSLNQTFTQFGPYFESKTNLSSEN